MINYGRILRAHEKDNTSHFCRASYLISNVGDMIKCYGRMLRFPDDAHIYQKEMELAMGDVIMQCRLIEEENNIEERPPKQYKAFNMATCLTAVMYSSSTILASLGESKDVLLSPMDVEMKITTEDILININRICNILHLNFEEVQHIGFIHTIERFEQFEREGWK